MMTKRIVVDDIQKKDGREQEKADLKQAELVDLVALLAQKAGLVDREGKLV
jgi:hypothetical protein